MARGEGAEPYAASLLSVKPATLNKDIQKTKVSVEPVLICAAWLSFIQQRETEGLVKCVRCLRSRRRSPDFLLGVRVSPGFASLPAAACWLGLSALKADYACRVKDLI